MPPKKTSSALKWIKYDLIANSKVTISASAEYQNIKKKNNKAVLLFKLYDRSNREIKENLLGDFSFSKHYNSFYKYIPDTKKTYLSLHTFVAPENVAYIAMAQSEFDLKGNERVLFNKLRVILEEQPPFWILELQNIKLSLNSAIQHFNQKVSEGNKVRCFINLNYVNTTVTDKKALLLLSFYDAKGRFLDYQPDGFVWTNHFSSYYKYLADTNNLELMVYSDNVPQGAESLRIGLASFDLKERERINVNHFAVEYAVPKDKNEETLKNLFYQHDEPTHTTTKNSDSDSDRTKVVFANSTLAEEVTLYQNVISEYQGGIRARPQNYANEVFKVIFILHSSLPYLSGGYATRAHGLIKSIQNAGIATHPYTRPGFPNDLKKKNLRIRFPGTDDVDNLTYSRLSSTLNRLDYDEKVFMWNSIEEYIKLFKEERPSIVHGRSTYLISLPAYVAALSLGIPFVYEVSGLWELVFESRSDAAEKIQRVRALETLVMKGADQVLTLTSDMKEEIVSRGVSENKITLIPNSVDINKFFKVEKDPVLQRGVGILEKDFIFGYIGSFVEYEGLDDLIYAFDKVASEIPNAKLLLIGSGNVKDKIVKIAQEALYTNRIIILDRIPHEDVVNYYSLLDVVVFARKGWDVCEKVSPMKPFEAMACEKVVLSSSVKALRDIVSDNVTGFVFEKDSIEDLSLHLKKLYFKKDNLEQMGKVAREWVVENRSWDIAGKRVADIYDKVYFQGISND